MLHINALTYRLGERLLIDNATAALPSGARVGLVGRNGAGKSTLFRLIRGELSPESGAISVPRGARLGSVEQEAPGGAETLIDFVLSADVERARAACRGGKRHRPRAHRRYPDPSRRHRRPCRAGARRADPERARLRRRCAEPGACRNIPAAGACAWRWPRCSSPRPTCCCSTSRPTTSISRACCGFPTI